MALQTLNPADLSLSDLRRRTIFTIARMQADTNAKPYMAKFVNFAAQLKQAIQTEQDLEDAIIIADAGSVPADVALDDLADKVSSEIHGSRRVNVSDPQHQLYFGSWTPSEFKRPTLGMELDEQIKWPELLARASDPALAALAAIATERVAAGQAAVKALQQASLALEQFRTDGQHKTMFDQWNALSKSAHGELSALVHQKPQLKLKVNYADTFFDRTERAAAPTTVREGEAQVRAAERILALRQKNLAELKAQQAERDQRKQQQAAATANLATARKVREDAAKQEKAARAALKAAKGPKRK
jgi:hypothetical protein